METSSEWNIFTEDKSLVERALGKKKIHCPEPSLQEMLRAVSLLYASFVACTRIIDYKHRPADVIVGGCIGVLAALG